MKLLASAQVPIQISNVFNLFSVLVQWLMPVVLPYQESGVAGSKDCKV